RRHYRDTTKALKNLNAVMTALPIRAEARSVVKEPAAPPAVLMVSGYNGIGIHSILAIQRFFPGHFKNFVFLSVGIIDSGRVKGRAEIDALMKSVDQDLNKYVQLTQRMGFYAESKSGIGTDVIEELVFLCQKIAPDWQKRVYFMGQLAFEGETFWNRLLHNQTSFELQRKLLFHGFEAVILPIRVRFAAESTPVPEPALLP